MPKEQAIGKPTTRGYSDEEKAAAVRMVRTLRAELGELDAQIEAGEFGPLRAWLRERIHAHGRKLPPAELLDRVTGQELAVAPFMGYLRGKLTDAGVLTSAPR